VAVDIIRSERQDCS